MRRNFLFGFSSIVSRRYGQYFLKGIAHNLSNKRKCRMAFFILRFEVRWIKIVKVCYGTDSLIFQYYIGRL